MKYNLSNLTFKEYAVDLYTVDETLDQFLLETLSIERGDLWDMSEDYWGEIPYYSREKEYPNVKLNYIPFTRARDIILLLKP